MLCNPIFTTACLIIQCASGLGCAATIMYCEELTFNLPVRDICIANLLAPGQ